ncbi:hypothetical protein [Anaerovorax sp. IOR16]|uniref:hypothetical protein n=1 Tax=Anaerovorax sp. IOR16 TaxID=2773458 RepID=UPI0019D0892F|nr:hypothetical protein [Anaerovorax sp. IOR16]
MIMTFYGAGSKCGVTMLCQSLAECLAEEHTEKKILLLNLSGSCGTQYSSTTFSYHLDDLRIKLSSKVLSVDELIGACAVSNNLYTLQGTQSLIERRKYQPEDVKTLFELARTTFDYVLVDGGSSVDFALNIGALLYADRNVLITSQNKGNLREYLQKNSQVLKQLQISFSKLIINRFYIAHFLPNEQELAKQYQIEHSTVVDYSSYSLQAENEGRTLVKMDKQYSQDVERLSKELFASPDDKKRKKKRKGIMRFWRKG